MLPPSPALSDCDSLDGIDDLDAFLASQGQLSQWPTPPSLQKDALVETNEINADAETENESPDCMLHAITLPFLELTLFSPPYRYNPVRSRQHRHPGYPSRCRHHSQYATTRRLAHGSHRLGAQHTFWAPKSTIENQFLHRHST